MGDKVKVIHNYDGITVPKIKDSVESFVTLAREEKCKVKTTGELAREKCELESTTDLKYIMKKQQAVSSIYLDYAF